jgi:hypothetical protein
VGAPNRKRFLGVCGYAAGACASAFIAAAHAHGGLSMDEDFCKLRVGKYFIHFTGYQPDNTTTKEFCEDIPATGRTIVVLDYVSDKLRDLPVEVRIVRDSGNTTNEADAAKLSADTVLHVPAKLYPAGTLHFEHSFQAPGKFVGLVSVKDAEQTLVSRFPFSVGGTSGGLTMLWPGVAAIVGGVALYFFARRKRDEATTSA